MLNFKNRIIIGFSISLIIIALVNYSSYNSLKSYKNRSERVEHTYDVLVTTKETLIQLLIAEASLGNFALTNQDKQLNGYITAKDSIQESLDKLSNLISDNPNQIKRVKKLEGLVEKILLNIDESIDGSKKLQTENEELKTLITNSQELILEIRNISSDIINEENFLLQKRNSEANERVSRTILSIYFGLILVVVIIFIMFGFIMKTHISQQKSEESANESNKKLKKLSEEKEDQNWLLNGEKRLNTKLQGEHTLTELSELVLLFFSRYLDTKIGSLHLWDEDKGHLKLTGTYAYKAQKDKLITALGEGLVGQVAKDQSPLLVTSIPEDYYKIGSSLGEMYPNQLMILPLIYQKRLIGVLELGYIGIMHPLTEQLIETVSDNISIAITTAQSRNKMELLYEQLQSQAEELESQQDELRKTNEELSHQAEMLRASEEELRVQQEELKQSNISLEDKALLLEEKNKAVKEANEAIALKAQELEQTSKFKSEFLANMSHELRTPLNSILVLAKMLQGNKSQHLDEEEVKYAQVIHKAGTDLLTLINDILDLSKVESGKLDIYEDKIQLEDVCDNMRYLFKEVANDKKIDFEVRIAPEAPSSISTDRQRLDQIIRNLLSNAFKFTPESGRVSLIIEPKNASSISISVQDTGIGISPKKQELIFQAFKQADGSTSRKYGGTGLGLSISKELAQLLKGSIRLESTEGKGSVFTLEIPTVLGLEGKESTKEESPVIKLPNNEPSKSTETPARPITTTKPDQRTLLIVEDDVNFSGILEGFAKQKGFETIAVYDGGAAMETLKTHKIDAVILDIMLPVMDGWEVLRLMKEDGTLSHIPVHIMSASNSNPRKIAESGAQEFIQKPVEKDVLERIFEQLQNETGLKHNRVLIVEDQAIQSDVLKSILEQENFEIKQAFDGSSAIKLMEDYHFDCIILDLNLPDIKGEEILDKIKEIDKNKDTPVIINTAMELPEELMGKIMKHSNSMVIKTEKSNERILDEVKLFIHKINQENKNHSRKAVSLPKQNFTTSLEGKKLLLVDDDMRNIFALSSSLQQNGLTVEIANNGLEALKKLEENTEMDLVLMDIMMPEMDGFEAMKRIRSEGQHKEIPIIALTAKAMRSDREKCLESGASDYIAKPVDMDKLLSMIRVWLSN